MYRDTLSTAISFTIVVGIMIYMAWGGVKGINTRREEYMNNVTSYIEVFQEYEEERLESMLISNYFGVSTVDFQRNVAAKYLTLNDLELDLESFAGNEYSAYLSANSTSSRSKTIPMPIILK